MVVDIISQINERQKKEWDRKQVARDAVKQEHSSRVSQKPHEELLFEKFKKIAKGKKFVELAHIDALGLEYDVLFFTTIKNTGKTRNIVFNRFHHYYLRGQKVIYIRSSLKEIESHREELNDSAYNPFLIVKHSSGYKLIDKKNGEDCGICVDMKNANAISGGEFKDYGAIIFDEALTWNSKNMINEAHISNFFALPSSIQRNKEENIKVYLISNIPPTKKNLILLDQLGIDLDENLRYIQRGNPHNPNAVCKILFINAGSIYPGINDQGGAAQMASQVAKLILNSNKLISAYDNTIGTDLFDFLDSKFAFIFTYRAVDYVLFLKHACDPLTNQEVYCLYGRSFDPTIYIDSVIYTDNKLTQAMYGRVVKYFPSIKWYKSQLLLLMRRNKLLFADDNSVVVSRMLYDSFIKEHPVLF